MFASVTGDQFTQINSECRHACKVLKEMIYSSAINYTKAQVMLIIVTQESVQKTVTDIELFSLVTE